MNKELSKVLRDKLQGMPFVHILAGMVQTVTTESMDETNSTKITKRFPVSTDVIGKTCEGPEIPLWPDSSYKTLIYFEDFGIASTGRAQGQTGYNSSLRLICWLNRANLVGDQYKDVTGRIMATIIDTIAGKNPQNIGMFTRLTIDVARIPPQDAGLFGRYTYNEADRQYLRPPYDFFGIDFSCKYVVPAKCLDGINWNIQTCS